MIHQMSTTTVKDEYVLNCTCCPTGHLFIGDKDGVIRNMIHHQNEIARQPYLDAGRVAEVRDRLAEHTHPGNPQVSYTASTCPTC